MSDAYSTPSSAPFGSSMTDLISTQKGGVQNLSRVSLSLGNAFPQATASSSPVATGVNTLGTTATTVLVAANVNRHGILVHNPGATATIYIFPSNMTPAPSLSSTGGALGIGIGSTVFFPSSQFPNFNCGLSGFAGTGSGNPFTVWEFY